MKWILFILLVPVVGACIVPEDGMLIDKSVEFCTGVYYFDSGIKVSGENIKVDCAGSVLKSWSFGKGISIEHAKNVTVHECRLLSYKYGFYVRNSSRVFLIDNHLLKNLVGARFVSVSDSALFNHDVSLLQPIESELSENNIFSFTNKVLETSICESNHCNVDRQGVELFMLPRTDKNKMGIWLSENIGGKTKAKLHNWVFSVFN
ncbi:hypothetical protein COV18_07585 [Candidatus Woesearchaeota archaeon CG10_big_fil_rev_8_21_14_0_10_37_12]|nr:MAG: hypothetical protein COV18_07585 [Candidatus Woesearchaeota archaeon CG10_big_fil_rev_8_21_14_0_10_37_12]